MNLILNILSSVASTSEGGSSGGSGGQSLESLKKIFQSPILYIVLGAIVLLIIVVYLIRRVTRSTPEATTIIVRGGQIHKVLNEPNQRYFLVPFRDHVGAIISSKEAEFSSDKLFINNGPDALYKVHYTLTYKVNDPVAFYPYAGKIQDLLVKKLNDELRLYADQGHALTIVKDYRENAAELLSIINKAVEEYHIEATEFKINIIEPLGGRQAA